MRCLALIVAGGYGARFGADVPKQYLTLAGAPVIRRTVRAHRAPAHAHAALDLRRVKGGRAADDSKIARHRERHAPADAPALDGGDGDRLDILPRLAHARPGRQPLAPLGQPQGADLVGFGVAQVEAHGEIRAAGEDDRRGLMVALETACGLGQLAHRFERQRIGAIAAVQGDGRDPAVPFDPDMLHRPSSAISLASSRARTPSGIGAALRSTLSKNHLDQVGRGVDDAAVRYRACARGR